MTTPVRYGIVGCSGIGNTHAGAVKACEGAELVACADLDPEAGAAFADDHDIEQWYEDVATMIEDSDVDAVSVCTPSGTHSTVVESAAAAGANVLCEKPLDVRAERIDRMIAACEDAGVLLAGVYQQRTKSAVVRAKELVESGAIGTPVLGDVVVKWHRSQEYYDDADWRGTREMDGGVLMNQAIHGIDLAQWLLGGIDEITAKTGTLGRDIEVEDTAVAAVEFGTGALGVVEATTATKPERPLRVGVEGTEGSFTVDVRNNAFVEANVDGLADETFEETEWGVAHGRVVADFVEAVATDTVPMVPAGEARKAVDAVLAMYESASTDSPVRPESIRR